MRDIHSVIFDKPLVKGGSADTHFSANIRQANTSLNVVEGVLDLAISEF